MEKKLRIGFASIEDASSVSSWSGIPLNVLRVLRTLPDVEVELISPLGKGFKRVFAIPKLYSKLTKKNYDWKREPMSLALFASQIQSAFRDRKLDVIFSTSSVPGTRLNASIPYVFWTDATFHIMEGYYAAKFMKRSRALGRRQEEQALRRSNFACYASQWAAQAARRFAEESRVKVLPFGPNLPIEHTHADVTGWIGERRTIRPGGCVLLFVGIGWERKGGAIALEAARRLNEAGIPTTLKIVGSQAPGDLPPYVEQLGFINKNEPEGQSRLAQLYRTSDIFILPSRAEAFGVVVAEAAAFGVPALVSDTGGLAETVSEGSSGFTIPLSDNGTLFAERAKTILADYANFAESAYAEFEQRLNWTTSVLRLVDLLKQAAGHNA